VALSSAPDHIRVNAVLPGALDSAAFRQFAGPAAAGFAERVPLGRLGAPADLANAVVFLLSDDAAFVTGAGLLVDGGMAWRV
jgi:NAD(P)-dependent dehydrogenase (short-subunit alcohol dehydrogenase family)